MQRIAFKNWFNRSHAYEIIYFNEPCLIPVKGFNFKLGHEFKVQVNNVLYRVFKDFETDLASVPRPLWAIYSPNDTRTIKAAILHDYMYRFNTGLTRREIDVIFYYGLLKGGCSRLHSWEYYLGVRAFGWMFYRK